MKIKCWQGECEEGKTVCCYDCKKRFDCEDSCDGKGCRMEYKAKDRKAERFGEFITVLTVIIWALGFRDMANDSCSYLMAGAMFASLAMWLKVIIPERDEKDV